MNYYNNPYYGYQQQTTYLPLTFVNGIEGAKAFIVGAGQTVYLKDSDSNILYEKKADAQGRYTLTAYELTPIDLNKPKVEQTYVTLDVFNKTIEELKRGLTNEPITK